MEFLANCREFLFGKVFKNIILPFWKNMEQEKKSIHEVVMIITIAIFLIGVILKIVFF